MKQKKLFTLISAAVIALTAIPMLPVTAAEETAPPAAEETVKNPFEAFTPGFDYAEYGSTLCEADFKTPETDSYYIGIRVKLSQPEVTVNLVSEFKDRTFGNGEKFAEIEADRGKYDLICNDDRSEYWCIPSEPAEKLTLKARMHIDEFLEQIERAGLPVGTLEAIEPLSSAGMETWHISMDMQYPELTDIGARIKDVLLSSTFNGELYQCGVPQTGEAWITRETESGFTASWKDLPKQGFTQFTGTTTQAYPSVPYHPLYSNRIQYYHYAADADLQGTASIGMVMRLGLNSQGNKSVRMYIIDAWNGERPSYNDHLRSFTLNSGEYDLYYTEQEWNVGDPVSGFKDTLHLPVYVAVRRENLLGQTGAGKIENTLNLSAFFRELYDYGIEVDNMLAGAAAFVTEGTGTVTFTRNEPEGVKLEQTEVFTEETTEDGYYQRVYSETPLEYKYEKGGKVSASWSDSGEVNIYCGKRFNEPVTAESLGQIDYSYAADVTLKNDSYAGVIVGFADATNSTERGSHFIFADAYSGGIPEHFTPFGEYTLHGEKYSVYGLADANSDQNYYWILRQNNLLGTKESGKIENTVDITGHLAEMKKLGAAIPKIRQISAFAAAQPVGMGSVAFTKNELQLTQKAERPLKDYFRLGKTMVTPDFDANDSIRDFSAFFDVASLENILIPANCLNAKWTPDQPIEIELDTLQKKYLASCEANGVPVVIGPFISGYMLPTAYYQNADGSYVKPEVMQARFDAIIKAMFEALEKEYPKLIIDSAIVTSDVYTQFTPSSMAKDAMKKIYGEDSTDYVAAAFNSAKKYAPEGCRLYMEEMLNPEPPVLSVITTDGSEIWTTDIADIKVILDAAEALKKAKVPVDGIALCCEFSDESCWAEEQSHLGLALDMLRETELDLILSDVIVSVTPPYDDTQRVKVFKAAFADFIRNSDNISMVLLSDSEFKTDGPHPVSQTAGFNTVIPDALAMQNPASLAGDVNCDTRIDVSDAVLLARFLAEDKTVKIDAQGRINSDANGDGAVASDDVIHILRVIAKII